MKYFLLLLITFQLAADWGTPFDLTAEISSTDGSVAAPQIAVNAAGNAVAVWESFNVAGNYISIQAAVYNDPITGWVEFGDISATTMFAAANSPQVSINASGNAVAVWQIQPTAASLMTIQAATYDATTGMWGAPAVPSPMTTDHARTPQIGLDDSGNAVAVWVQFDLLTDSTTIEAATYSTATQLWTSSPIAISATETPPESVSVQQVSVNATGQAIAIWQQNTTSVDSVIAAATSTTTTNVWTSITTTGSPAGINPQVGIDAAGNAVAVWSNTATSPATTIQAATLPFGTTTWLPTTPANLTATTGSNFATVPQIKVDTEGDAIAVWHFQQTAGNTDIIQAGTLPFGGIWDLGTGANLSSNAVPVTNTTASPQVSINADGHAVAIWEFMDTILLSQSIQGSFYNGTSWSAPSVVTGALSSFETPTITAPGSTAVGIDSSDNATAIWQLSETFPDNFTIIQTNLFQPAPAPPTNFTGRIIKNNFLTQTDVIDLLSWSPSPDASTVSYQILLGTEVLATISASGPLTASIHNRIKHTYTYALVALNAAGAASTPIYLTVTQ